LRKRGRKEMQKVEGGQKKLMKVKNKMRMRLESMLEQWMVKKERRRRKKKLGK
jgi:hypothetical protein